MQFVTNVGAAGGKPELHHNAILRQLARIEARPVAPSPQVDEAELIPYVGPFGPEKVTTFNANAQQWPPVDEVTALGLIPYVEPEV